MHDKSIERRTLLKTVGLLAAGIMGGVREGAAAQPVPFSAGTEPPNLKVPANACDCHMHIYDNRFPYVPNATLRPPEATVADYRRLQQRLGLTRAVVVTPSSSGTDNSCTLAAIAELGPIARGIAVVDPGVTDAELQRLDSLGVRRPSVVGNGGAQVGRGHCEIVDGAAAPAEADGADIAVRFLVRLEVGDRRNAIGGDVRRLKLRLAFSGYGE